MTSRSRQAAYSILKVGDISVIVMNYEVGVLVVKCRARLYVKSRFIV